MKNCMWGTRGSIPGWPKCFLLLEINDPSKILSTVLENLWNWSLLSLTQRLDDTRIPDKILNVLRCSVLGY